MVSGCFSGVGWCARRLRCGIPLYTYEGEDSVGWVSVTAGFPGPSDVPPSRLRCVRLVVDAFLYTFEYIVGKVWRGVARCGGVTLVVTYLYFNLTLP